MTIKDLQRIMQQHQTSNDSAAMQDLLNRVRGKPFYVWGSNRHNAESDPRNAIKGQCCFNHIIGLPKKHNVDQPLWDYQHIIYKALTQDEYLNQRIPTPEEEERLRLGRIAVEYKASSKTESIKKANEEYLKNKAKILVHKHKLKHCAILKAAKLGISELILRFLVWLCLRNDDLKGSQMIIFTGPRLELAVSLISRIKDFFKPFGITFPDKETVVNLNGVRIEAFPSHHAATARGLPSVSAVFVDEASYIPDNQASEIMSIMLRYVPASNPFLICVSTPQKPGDMMDQILKQPYETSPFKEILLDWTYGVGKTYDEADILKIKNSRSFLTEYCLKFAGLEGNVLSQSAIDRCIKLGERMNETAPIDNWNIETDYVMSVDIGWGSSSTAVMVSRFVNGKVQIVYSREFERRTIFQDIINEIWRLKSKCGNKLKNIIIDASATELYTTLCTEFNQNPSLKYLQDKQKMAKDYNTYLEKYCFIVPVAFGSTTQGGRTMLNHAQRLIEETEENPLNNEKSALLAIHPSFQDLIDSCRSAYADGDHLDKGRTVHNDSFDSMLLNLSYYRWSNK